MRGQAALCGHVAPKLRYSLERRGEHRLSGRGFGLRGIGHWHQRVRDQVRHARQELGAHAGMKAIPIRAAQCEQSNAALLTQRDERHGADVIGVRPEEEFALRVTSLSTSWLAIGE